MHLHSTSDRSVGYFLFMRRSVCHRQAKPIYWTVSLGNPVISPEVAAIDAQATKDKGGKELPKTGGANVGVLLGLGAGVALIGGGPLARRSSARPRS